MGKKNKWWSGGRRNMNKRHLKINAAFPQQTKRRHAVIISFPMFALMGLF